MRAELVDQLVKASESGEDMFLIVGDLGYGVVEPYSERFPAQFLNAGVSEQSMVSLAAGIATQGPIVFVYSIANFPTFRALEQIRNDVYDHGLPVVVISVGAGLSYGALGYSHHAVEDLSVMRALRGLDIYSPGDTQELRQVMETIFARRRPSYLRLSKEGANFGQSCDRADFPTGTVLLRGKPEKMVILSTGSIGTSAKQAVLKLDSSTRAVTSLYSVADFNGVSELAHKIKNSSAIVTVEEHNSDGGFGTHILETLSSAGHQVPLLRLGTKNGIRHAVGDHDYLRKVHGLDPDSISKAITNFSRSVLSS